eukprot:TRINITY_DN29655_c0_g1_i1.p1 TRINITY_DN29655_c0_g1~~TRINITY_DN29655_c0_g1_i1.p1  ORF type:complete len:632 (-),score=192.19 TRINITY_DN29655_c0_g1_i1:362-2257(-)
MARKRDSEEKRRRSGERKRKKRRRTPSDSEDDSDDSNRSGTPPRVSDEKLKEYMAKKAQKKALKVARALKTSSVAGYTNDSNPFGDTSLTEKFVWRKKIEKDVMTGVLDPRDLTLKAERLRQEERTIEIDKVKKRRTERELEKAQHEEEMTMLARERARAEFQDWEKKEEEFHFEQSKVRSEIRLREGRAKPIDVLAKNLTLSDDFDVEINEPYKIYKGLTVKEMEELRTDIKMHGELDRAAPINIRFWEAMLVVCDAEIAEATRRDILDRARVRGEEPPPDLVQEADGMHQTVDADVQGLLGGKSSEQLTEVEGQIQERMRRGEAKVVEYWEAVLKRLQLFRAKAVLREIHNELLRKHLTLLQEAEARERAQQEDAAALRAAGEAGEGNDDGNYSPDLLAAEDGGPGGGGEPGSFSPELLHTYEGEDVVDPEADKAQLEQKRAQVLEDQQRRLLERASGEAAGADESGQLTAAEKQAATKAMGQDEGDAILGAGAEVTLESQVYWWHDKYRPRKPKYFNRVHTGYEWNKYNQTHYDHDNPPPKIVQGYKFNIFFPDLIDKTKAPTYIIERDGSTGETCLIRFHAGPPYEDIAFRIVNKEWEYSHKKGFKCTFERGILHVYFNFKRYRYRR